MARRAIFPTVPWQALPVPSAAKRPKLCAPAAAKTWSGGQRSSGHFDKKQDAVDRTREISKNQETELVIHNKDGKISEKDSHGNDPFPPSG